MNNALVSQVVSYAQSAIGHLSPSHHQHDPDLCVDDTMSSDLFSDDQLAQGTSIFECTFASGFDVAKTCSAVSGSRHPSVVADRAGLSPRIAQTECTHLRELLVHQMRRHHELLPLSCIDRSQKRQRRRREERRNRLPRSAREPHRLRARTLPVRDATANFMSSTLLRDRSCAAVGGVSPEHRVR